MNERNQALIEKLSAAIQECLQAIASLLISLALLVVTIARALAVLFAQMFRIITGAFAQILKAGIVAAVLLSAVTALPVTFQAYQNSDADLLALIPAAVITILPPVIAIGTRAGWAGLLLAALVTFASGQIVAGSSPMARALYISGALVGLIVITLTTSSADDEQDQQGATHHEEQEYEVGPVGHHPEYAEDRPTPVHGLAHD